ncbi:MAG: patatin-like phospholipase family protein, partial [Chitinophagales bacterium]
ILKAIDSTGLKIDYVTGTSMGAIIGALYSVGYSGESIQKIAQKIDWDLVLSNQYPLKDINLMEKSEYGKYDIELPWVNNWFRLSTGVLQGQELWIRFSELFFPVYPIKKFSEFAIPFECIGTDISNGEAVAIDSGEIISAVRASMAIPSLFTAVEYDGKKLVDGGIVRNFPVKDVREMGADIVIGSNVSNALLAADKVTNALQVLLQIAFFREAEDTRTEVPLCNIYVQGSLDKFNMASFSQADEIIQAGMTQGRALYPRLKKLADSLNAIYGPDSVQPKRVPEVNEVKISAYEVRGNLHTTTDFIVQSTGILTNHYYTPKALAQMVLRAVGTRYYSQVTYSLQPLPDGSAKIIFDVKENPLTFAKIGLHYDQFSGISAIVNLTSRDLFTPNSRSLVTVNIGENFRARAEHLQYFGRDRNIGVSISPEFERFNITTYEQTKESGLYTQQYIKADGKIIFATDRDLILGVGTRYEWIKYSPSITASQNFSGDNRFATSYLFMQRNTLDRPLFPKRGFKLDVEGDIVYEQHPAATIKSSSDNLDTLVSANSYTRILLNMQSYTPLSTRTTLMMMVQSGINFNYENSIMNEFSIGGLVRTFHNQAIFAGLKENSYYSTSLAAMQVGLRYQLYSNVYLTARANVMWNNFVNASRFFPSSNFLSGYALTFSYNFALGPLEVSAMYSDQWHKILGYINIGIPF